MDAEALMKRVFALTAAVVSLIAAQASPALAIQPPITGPGVTGPPALWLLRCSNGETIVAQTGQLRRERIELCREHGGHPAGVRPVLEPN
jgi:hypothetical protein